MADGTLPTPPSQPNDGLTAANGVAEIIVRLQDENKNYWFQINRHKDMIAKNEATIADLQAHAEWTDPNAS